MMKGPETAQIWEMKEKQHEAGIRGGGMAPEATPALTGPEVCATSANRGLKGAPRVTSGILEAIFFAPW